MSSPPPAAEQETGSAPPPDEPRTAGPRLGGADLRNLGGLRRSRTDRKVAGVAGGLGAHLDLDPTIIRVALVVLTLFGGAGVVLYATAWLLVPDEGSDQATIDLEASVRTIVLAAVAGLSVLALLGHAWGFFDFPWPLAVVGLIVLAVLAGQGRLGGRRPADATGPAPGRTPPVSLDKSAGPASAPSPGYSWTPPSYAAPPPSYAAPPPPPRRRRGPRLFLPALALIALGWGTLWLVELGGAELGASAYAALALAVCGLLLVVGAWFGRTAGVVLLGVVAVVALSVTRASDGGFGTRVDVSPTSAAGLAADYDMTVGRMTVDLTGIDDLASLDGREISLDGRVGRIVVLVPDGLDVTATAEAEAGRVEVFGDSQDGDSPRLTRTADGGADAPRLTIDADLDLGDITVRTS